jgi:hypothetical protein
MRVNEAVVISLPDRPDRLSRFLRDLPADWPFPSPRLQEGVRESAPPWFRASDGAWGCRQSHLQILQSAWERSIPNTLILEDDAVFEDDFAGQWAALQPRIPSRASMVMLGGQHVRPPKPQGAHLVQCVNTRRTHAYIIRLKAIPLLMRTWAASCQHIDHALIGFLSATFTYAPAPFLVGQDAGWSDISRKENPQVRFWT